LDRKREKPPQILKPWLYSGRLFLSKIQCKIVTQMSKRRKKAGTLLLFSWIWKREEKGREPKREKRLKGEGGRKGLGTLLKFEDIVDGKG
jgi:hypothetical protein